MKGEPLYEERYMWVSNICECGAYIASDGVDSEFHIDITGKPLYEERYKYVGNYRDGIAHVSKDDKAFHIDMKGNPIYAERFDAVYTFVNGIAKVKLDDNILYIDKTGKAVDMLASYLKIGSREDTLYVHRNKDGVLLFLTGCFNGTLEEFEKAVNFEHKDRPVFFKQYMDIIELYK